MDGSRGGWGARIAPAVIRRAEVTESGPLVTSVVPSFSRSRVGAASGPWTVGGGQPPPVKGKNMQRQTLIPSTSGLPWSGASGPAGPDAIWRRFHASADPQAREALIQNYLPLVRITVGRAMANTPPSVERGDLTSAGIVGLIRAIDDYDSTRGVKFETYAITLIRSAILELLRKEDWASRSVRARINELERAYATVEAREGRPGTDVEVAAELRISLDELYDRLSEAAPGPPLSLDELLFMDQSGQSQRRADAVADDASGTLAHLELRERKRVLAEAIDRLPARERQVLALYYYEGLTYKEIGRALGVSEARAFQLQRQAILRIRGMLALDRDLFTAGEPAAEPAATRAR
jgi:RNA polymerase sigma factor FliA